MMKAALPCALSLCALLLQGCASSSSSSSYAPDKYENARLGGGGYAGGYYTDVNAPVTRTSSGPRRSGGTTYAASRRTPPRQMSAANSLFKGVATLQLQEAEAMRNRMRARAATGDPEAQQWLRENSANVDLMRRIYDQQVQRDREYYGTP